MQLPYLNQNLGMNNLYESSVLLTTLFATYCSQIIIPICYKLCKTTLHVCWNSYLLLIVQNHPTRLLEFLLATYCAKPPYMFVGIPTCYLLCKSTLYVCWNSYLLLIVQNHPTCLLEFLLATYCAKPPYMFVRIPTCHLLCKTTLHVC